VVVIAVCIFVGIAVIAVLAAIAIPSFARARQRAQATMAMSNARQLHQAVYRMVLDNSVAPNPDLGWPGDLAVSTVRPVVSLGQYVDRLVEYKYLERESLPQLFKAPGIPPYPGTGVFDSEYSPFKMYRVKETDLDTCLFLATRNFAYGSGLDPAVQPFGSQVGVIVRKGGDAQALTSEKAQSTEVGRLPGKENRGVETAESVLKM
jgi:hypothetical protein